MRSFRRAVLALLVVIVGSTVIGPVQALQPQPAPTDPALFDLDLATAQLDAIQTERDRIRRELADALDAIEGLTIERDFIELNDQSRNQIMQDSRTRARNMAIDAYIGIGPPISGVVVLNAESANELSYRRGLLRQQAQRLQEASDTYSLLAGEADESVLNLVDGINDEIRRTEGLNRALARETAKVPHAEWVVSIAEIHRLADQEFARTGRAEPTAEQWRLLRHCESTERYDTDTGNSFYGAYQFEWRTWLTVGGSDENPALAPAAEQDARARLLYARRGAQPWPICGRFLPRS